MASLYIKNNGKWSGLPTLKGEKGEKGDQGEKGETGEQGETGEKGESGVYIGDTEPTDEDINVWVDTTTSTEPSTRLIDSDTCEEIAEGLVDTRYEYSCDEIKTNYVFNYVNSTLVTKGYLYNSIYK